MYCLTERMEYVDRQLEARGILIEEYHRLSEAKRQYEQAWTRYLHTGSADDEASVTKWGDVLSAHPERVKEVNTSLSFILPPPPLRAC